MNQPINRRVLVQPPLFRSLAGQSANSSTNQSANNLLGPRGSLVSSQNNQSSLRSFLQANNTIVNLKRDRSHPDSVTKQLSRLVKNNLSPTQKSNLHNLTALLKLVSTDKFSDMIKPKFNSSSSTGNAYSSSFFSPPGGLDNSLTYEEIVEFVHETELCPHGLEEELVDTIVDLCEPGQTHYLDLENMHEFSSSIKHMLHEFDVEERPSILEEIATLLENMKNTPLIASGEQKKKLLDILKDSEDKKESEHFDFDYWEINDI
ncbi:MAG: hypothetical protein V4591_02095 [Bdellovibrionota bacterium]